ncbi:MAG: hypothetical protein OXC62_03615 [Aestuariivita sp.]|nr:hypothetical protein [Aestuariivita sp.]
MVYLTAEFGTPDPADLAGTDSHHRDRIRATGALSGLLAPLGARLTALRVVLEPLGCFWMQVGFARVKDGLLPSIIPLKSIPDM